MVTISDFLWILFHCYVILLPRLQLFNKEAAEMWMLPSYPDISFQTNQQEEIDLQHNFRAFVSPFN